MPKQKIAIVTFCYLPFDAVSTDALGMRDTARKLGFETEIFAEYTPPDFNNLVRPIELLSEFVKESSDLIIYHFSIGWEKGERLIGGLSCQKWIKFHNITPPQFFEGVETVHAYSCRFGRAMIPHLGAMGASLYLSDSEFNQSEIQPFIPRGIQSKVLYPFHQVVSPRPRTKKNHSLDPPFFLAVGRLAPNKRVDLLIEGFAKFCRMQPPADQTKLVIVGRPDPNLITYTQYLQAVAQRLKVESRIQWCSYVDREILLNLYQQALSLVITSEHEGFCVPVAEAFAQGCPVISSIKTALKETLANAALTFENYDSDHLAACLLEITENPKLRETLSLRGKQEFHTRFAIENISYAFENLLGEKLI